MTTNLATYIGFPGNCAEAFEHYQDVIGGELEILKYGDNPVDMGFEPDPNAVAHAVLTTAGGTLAGADAMPGENKPLRDTAYSLLFTLDNPDDARAIIRSFVSAGGSESLPFELAPWGDWYGHVFDKYGVMWALSVPAANA